MMATDSERREVARRLHRLADKYDGVAAFIVERYLGLESDDRFLFGSLFTSDSVQRIADLIDPDCRTQEADSSPVPEHNADLNKMVAFAVWALALALAVAMSGCSRDAETSWPESAEFSTLDTGQDRFSVHGTNLDHWYVIVDHRTGAQYLYRYEYGITPLLDTDGTPLLVAEAGE